MPANKKAAIIPNMVKPPRTVFKPVLLLVKTTLTSLHPFHWFDGFMDGIEIELSEFQQTGKKCNGSGS